MPVVQTGGAGEAVIHRSLIWVSELVDRELVTVLAPAAVQIAFDGREIDVVIAAAEVGAVEQIEQNIEADDLQCRNKIALFCSPLRRRRKIDVRRGRQRRVDRLRQ